jgi:hypothetical protein
MKDIKRVIAAATLITTVVVLAVAETVSAGIRPPR